MKIHRQEEFLHDSIAQALIVLETESRRVVVIEKIKKVLEMVVVMAAQ